MFRKVCCSLFLFALLAGSVLSAETAERLDQHRIICRLVPQPDAKTIILRPPGQTTIRQEELDRLLSEMLLNCKGIINPKDHSLTAEMMRYVLEMNRIDREAAEARRKAHNRLFEALRRERAARKAEVERETRQKSD